MVRKIIQIETVMHHSFFEYYFYIYALCDDGTLWVRTPHQSDKSWQEIEQKIPQD